MVESTVLDGYRHAAWLRSTSGINNYPGMGKSCTLENHKQLRHSAIQTPTLPLHIHGWNLSFSQKPTWLINQRWSGCRASGIPGCGASGGTAGRGDNSLIRSKLGREEYYWIPQTWIPTESPTNQARASGLVLRCRPRPFLRSVPGTWDCSTTFSTLDAWQPCRAKNVESFRQEVNGWFPSWYISCLYFVFARAVFHCETSFCCIGFNTTQTNDKAVFTSNLKLEWTKRRCVFNTRLLYDTNRRIYFFFLSAFFCFFFTQQHVRRTSDRQKNILFCLTILFSFYMVELPHLTPLLVEGGTARQQGGGTQCKAGINSFK